MSIWWMAWRTQSRNFALDVYPCDDVLVAPANFYKTAVLRNELGSGSDGSTNAEVVKKGSRLC